MIGQWHAGASLANAFERVDSKHTPLNLFAAELLMVTFPASRALLAKLVLISR